MSTSWGTGRHKDIKVLKDLASLLHSKGDAVLRGESKLSLTSQSLGILYNAFQATDEYQNETSSRNRSNQILVQLYKDLLFLQEFLHKTKSVKVIHRSGTIKGAIQIGYFTSLETLEIKKVPIHLVEGLHKLRCNLKSITCTRCLPMLQDLFESCGGDMTSPMSWVNLKEACLSYNTISCVDSSLRLLPALEVLDLSHNNLETLENHLQYLTELVHINLGYNSISSVPPFSLSVRTKLKTLILRNNKLEHLEGVEDLVNLEELDVTNNCLTDHSGLDVLNMLDNLSVLCLLGNPLSYHTSHRTLTIQHISPIAARSNVVVDGKKLTESETMLTVRNRVLTSASRRPTHVAHNLISETQQIANKYTFSDSDAIAQSLPVSVAVNKKKVKSKTKVRSRKSLIAEFESSTDTTTGISSRDSSRAPSPTGLKDSNIVDTNKEKFEVMREHYGTDWLRAVNNDPDSIPESAVRTTEDDIYLNDSGTGLGNGTCSSSLADVNTNITTEGTLEECVFSERTLSVETDENRTEVKLADSEHGIEWKRTDSQQQEYYGVESDPFIVTLKNHTNLFICLNDRYLLEKDMNGDLMEMLDLKLLESVENGLVNQISEPSVRLTFDYIRKDRRERTYMMEDVENTQELLNLLQPKLEAKLAMQKLREQLQCLKCSSVFLKSEAVAKKIEGNSRANPYTCPKCGSEMVVEMEIKQPSLMESSPPVLGLQPKNCSTPQKPTVNQGDTSGSDADSPRPVFIIGSYEHSQILHKSGEKKRLSLPILPSGMQCVKATTDASVSSRGLARTTIQETTDTQQEDTVIRKPINGFDSKAGGSQTDFRARENSTGSDIAILSNPSDGSVSQDCVDDERRRQFVGRTVSPILERSTSYDHNVHSLYSQADKACVDEISDKLENSLQPIPLSLNVCNSMVSSVYENSIKSSSPDNLDKPRPVPQENVGELSIYDTPTSNRLTEVSSSFDTCPVADMVDAGLESTANEESCEEERTSEQLEQSVNTAGSQIQPETDVCDKDFTVFDHRLQLYFHISLLKETEESVCMLQCGIVQYMVKEEFEGYLLLTTENIYILKILPEIRRKKELEPKAWLKCIEVQPHSELQYLDIGIGVQSFRLEFNTDCSSYSFLVRDEVRCRTFIELIKGNLQDSSHLVVEESNPDTMENLLHQVVLVEMDLDGEADEYSAQDVHYISGFLHSDGTKQAVGIVLTESNIHLVEENHQWPLPRLQSPLSPDIKGKQFTPIEKQHINNVVQILQMKEEANVVKILFDDEDQGKEIEWYISMETYSGVKSLVNFITVPWEAEFGVELDIAWL